jgi:hypothetical protein
LRHTMVRQDRLGTQKLRDLDWDVLFDLVAQVDSDGSGEIDVDEFVVFMRPFMARKRHFWAIYI